MHAETRYSPNVGVLILFVFAADTLVLSVGRARHPGPCKPPGPSGCSVEFLTVGGWLSGGDLALESPAHLLAVANVTTQLRKARRSSVWARSCQDVTPGCRSGCHQPSWRPPSLFPLFLILLSKSSFAWGAQWRHRPSLRHLWMSGSRERPGEADAHGAKTCCDSCGGQNVPCRSACYSCW